MRHSYVSGVSSFTSYHHRNWFVQLCRYADDAREGGQRLAGRSVAFRGIFTSRNLHWTRLTTCLLCQTKGNQESLIFHAGNTRKWRQQQLHQLHIYTSSTGKFSYPNFLQNKLAEISFSFHQLAIIEYNKQGLYIY